MTDYECKVCRNVIPPEAKCCEFCEVGFVIANEKMDMKYEIERDRQDSDDMQDLIQSMNYLGEKL